MTGSFDPRQLSPSEKTKIARQARRQVHSEIALILTFGFGAVSLIFFVLGPAIVIPVSAGLGLRPVAVWICLSAGLTGLWAKLHFDRATRSIAKAREMEMQIRRAESACREAEIAAKINAKNSW
jgi:hypothetical protein